MYTLRPYQKEAVDLTESILKGSKDIRGVLVAPTGCHTKDYPILMYDGTIKKVQDITIGDKLMGDDSTPRNVNYTIQGKGKIYRITTKRGITFDVNEDHILHLVSTTIAKGSLTAKQNAVNIKSYPPVVNISVRNYLAWAKSRKAVYKLKFTSVNHSGPSVKHPYFLGLWLGDGTSSAPEITNADLEVIAYLKAFVLDEFNFSIKLVQKNPSNKSYKIMLSDRQFNKRDLNPVTKFLREVNVFKNKHIPLCYQTAPEKDRLELLAGLIDTDGYYDVYKNMYEITLKDKELFLGLWQLLNGLGYFCRVKIKKVSCNNCPNIQDDYLAYRMLFHSDGRIPCKVERRIGKERGQKKRIGVTGFSVDYIGEDNYYGFNLDKNQLYVDGNYLVHHNSGKSLCIAELARRLPYPVLVLQPSKELLEQNYNKYISYGNEASIYSQSMNKREVGHVTFGTVGTVKSNTGAFKDLGVQCIIIDECHLGTKNSSTINRVIQAIGVKKVLGLTATPLELRSYDGTPSLQIITRSRKNLFKEILHVTQIKELVKDGFWCPIVYDIRDTDRSELKLNTTGTEYTDKSLQRFYESNKLNDRITVEVHRLIQEGRKSILIFMPGIDDSERMAAQIRTTGVMAMAVHSKLNKSHRTTVVDGFKDLSIRVVTNVNVLSIGFDHPELDAIIMGRPTASFAVFYQQLGRGVRIHPDKKNVKIVDFSGNIENFGELEDIEFLDTNGRGAWEMYNKQYRLTGFKVLRTPDYSGQEFIDTFWFGKHAGKTVAEVATKHPDYLIWMINSDFRWDSDKTQKLKVSVMAELEKRDLLKKVLA